MNTFLYMGCQKEARDNSQDLSGRESIPDDVSKTSPKAPAYNLVGSKEIENLPQIPKIGAKDLGFNRGSINL